MTDSASGGLKLQCVAVAAFFLVLKSVVVSIIVQNYRVRHKK